MSTASPSGRDGARGISEPVSDRPGGGPDGHDSATRIASELSLEPEEKRVVGPRGGFKGPGRLLR